MVVEHIIAMLNTPLWNFFATSKLSAAEMRVCRQMPQEEATAMATNPAWVRTSVYHRLRPRRESIWV